MTRPKTEEGRRLRECILDYCINYKGIHGYYPTQNEIKAELNMSTGSLVWHLDSLRAQSYIHYQPRAFARTLQFTKRQRRFLQ